jgi:hypothetical protein
VSVDGEPLGSSFSTACASNGRGPSIADDRTRLLDKVAFRDFILEIIRRTDTEPGFTVLPRRRVVERTFGWITRWRRLVRDRDARRDVSHAMSHVAMGRHLLRRFARQRAVPRRTLRSAASRSAMP